MYLIPSSTVQYKCFAYCAGEREKKLRAPANFFPTSPWQSLVGICQHGKRGEKNLGKEGTQNFIREIMPSPSRNSKKEKTSLKGTKSGKFFKKIDSCTLLQWIEEEEATFSCFFVRPWRKKARLLLLFLTLIRRTTWKGEELEKEEERKEEENPARRGPCVKGRKRERERGEEDGTKNMEE